MNTFEPTRQPTPPQSVVTLWDSLRRALQPLATPVAGRLRMYVCGPTVYGPAHIGNFLTFTRFDTLYRVLRAAGYAPYYVRNITDVDDKTIRGAHASGQDLATFTDHWTARFHADCAALNLLPPDVEPRATQHIAEQIALTQQLIAKGHAYVADDGSVYFSVASFPHYGCLSHFDPAQLQTQSTNSAGRTNLADEYERDSVADFALWKAWKAEDGAVAWDSPWGRGRPGWHLECSAMSMRYLGETFELHGGGEDLCFPHHENEIAQSEAATGKPFVGHWVHAVHLLVEGRKMSKSLGNFFTLDDLRQRGWQPAEIRLALLGGHYRQQFNFTFKGLEAARSALGKLQRGLQQLLAAAGWDAAAWEAACRAAACDAVPAAGWGVFQPAWDALCRDLNTPAALGALHVALRQAVAGQMAPSAAGAALTAFAHLGFALGLELRLPAAGPAAGDATAAPDVAVPDDIRSLAEQRWAARAARDFAQSDALRAALAAAGWQVKDGRDGYTLSRAESATP
jgi:cysteinyl-tRNA synthetase